MIKKKDRKKKTLFLILSVIVSIGTMALFVILIKNSYAAVEIPNCSTTGTSYNYTNWVYGSWGSWTGGRTSCSTSAPSSSTSGTSYCQGEYYTCNTNYECLGKCGSSSCYRTRTWTRSVSSSTTVCTRCNGGYYLDGSFCTICPAGKACDGTSTQTSCNGTNQYSKEGSSSCSTCDGSVNSSHTSCTSAQSICTSTPGSYWVNGSCIPCPSGYRAETGKNGGQCYITVPAGNYLGTAGGSTYYSCEAGTYSTGGDVIYGNISSCTSCGSGYTSALGATSSSECYLIVDQSQCDVTASTTATKVSYGDTFTVDVSVSGAGCSGQKVTLTPSRATISTSSQHNVSNGSGFHFTVTTTTQSVCSSTASLTVTLTNGKSSTATVTTAQPWQQTASNKCVTSASIANNSKSRTEAENNGHNVYYIVTGSCGDGAVTVDVWLRSGCGSDTSVPKTVTVTTNHYIEETTTPIKLSNGNDATSVVQNLHEGDSYTTSELSNKAEYYELVEIPSNATGTVGSTNIVVNYYYRLKSYNYTVNYLDKDTGTSIYTAKTGNAVYGNTINASDEVITISTYNYDSADNDSITIGTNATNNVINLYYVKKTGTVTVKYYNKIGNSPISGVSNESITGNVGTSYNTESKKKTIEGYDYDSSTNNTTGTITEEEITVIYYYKKKVTVTTNHYVEGTTTPIKLSNGNNSASVVQNLHEGDSYETNELSNKAEYYELVGTPSNATGTVGSTNIVVNYYYRLKSYNYTINYLDKDTGTSIYTAKTGSSVYGSTISASSEVITISTYTYDSADNDSITIGTNATNNVINLYYVKNAGRVTIKYYDKATNAKITGVADDGITGNVGTSYNTESKKKTIEGYDYDSSTNNTTGTITEEEITVIYYYKKKVTVTANHYLEGTTTPIKLSNGNNSASVVQNLHEGDSYETNELSNKAAYYELVSTPSNATGAVGSTNIVVNYYYRLKSYNYTVNYLDKDTGTSIHTAKTGSGVYGSTISASSEVITISTYTYDSADKTSITIGTNATNNVINLYYVKKTGTVTTKYVKQGTTEEIIASTVQTGKVGASYETTAKTISGYRYVSVTSNATGTYIDGNIDVVYSYKQTGKVTVRYIDKNTGSSLVTNVIINGDVGDEYTTEQKTITGYTFVEVSGTPEGVISSNATTVTYYYKKNTSVKVNHIDLSDNHVLDSEIHNGLVGDSYTASSKSFTGYILAESPENETVVMTNEQIELNYYYNKISSGVVEKHIDVYTDGILDSRTYTGNVGDSYTTSSKTFTGYDLLTNRLPSNASGTMTSDLIEVKYYYSKQAKVTVKYLDKEDNHVIADQVVINGHFGDEYNTTKKTISNYTYANDTGNTSGSMTKNNTEVIYYYELNNYNYNVKYIDYYHQTEEIHTQKTESKKYGSTVNATDEEIEIDGYTYYSANPNSITIKATGNNINLYYKKNVKLITNYYVEGTTTPIKLSNGSDATSASQDLHEGDSYTTSEVEAADYYELVATPSNNEGTMGNTDVTVNYYYRLKGYNYTVNYLDKDTGEIIHTAKVTQSQYGSTINAANEAIIISGYTYDSANPTSMVISEGSNVMNLYYKKSSSNLRICKEISGRDVGNVFQIKVASEDNSYETWVILNNNQCKTISLKPGTYRVTEIVPQEYRIKQISGEISTNGSAIVIQGGQNYNVKFVNEFIKKGFLHSSGRIVNEIGGSQ